MSDCSKCGWPGVPQTDDAFFFRYMILSPERKAALRKMVAVLIEVEQTSDKGDSNE